MNPKNTVPMFRFEISGSEMENKFVSTFREFLQSGQMSLGNQVSQFEIEFAKYIGVDHVVGVANGTDAIELALRALGVNRGSKVATVANAGFYTTTALLAIGASVVFMDVSSSSGLVTKEEVEHTLRNEKPDVIVITHLFGHVVSDMARIIWSENSGGLRASAWGQVAWTNCWNLRRHRSLLSLPYKKSWRTWRRRVRRNSIDSSSAACKAIASVRVDLKIHCNGAGA